MKKFAVVISGCGVFDGAEIHETVLTLLAIHQSGCDYEIFAPDIEQYHVINHLTGKPAEEKRNVLVESARIARGRIHGLASLEPRNFDALVMPGGFGAAKNLCDWALKGPDCTVLPLLGEIIRQFISLRKPIGAMCIAPVILGKVAGDVQITIGSDPVNADRVKKMGSRHVSTGHGEVVTDDKYLLFTTPCYMLDASISDIAAGTSNLIKAMLKVL